MGTQYSILSVLIRPEIQEKISIGLLLFNEDQVYFAFSKNKQKAARKLVHLSANKMLNDILVNIEQKLEGESSENAQKRGFKIFKKRMFESTFSASYISYLSKYSNNTVSFSSPKSINLDISFQNFEKLFERYVDELINEVEENERLKPFDIIQNRFGAKIIQHFDVNKMITPDTVPNLISNVKVEFAGKNEIDVFAQTIDMESNYQTVTNHINSFLQLKTTYLSNNISMKDFLVASEPDKLRYAKQHEVWNQLRDSNLVNYLDVSESQIIIDYAEEHKVRPLSATEE
ncbi:MAG: hypothetical protein P0Y53_00785 [Candidatus Pseudobacter hemicellulosilyticus]|uniref:DUF3037 domain-containing protein n=1 Tax=Candidatus Pseudobacter hemicellulosilyticus TaxID=3121375 RepID=A0AAJ6BI87_9BACT|nr:MAG: hypothetical protein P0Y53_00785 [Pseudobacter sp.]